MVRVPGGLRRWDLVAGRLTGRVLGGTGQGGGESWFMASGRTYAVNDLRRDLQLWDLRTGRLLLTVPEPHDEVRAVRMSPDDRLMAYCTGGPLQVWDVRRHQKVAVPWAARDLCDTQDFVFTPDSRALAFTMHTGAAQGALRTWDVRSGHERPRLSVPGLSEAEFSRDGAYAATLTGDEVQLWRLAAPAAPVLRVAATGSGLNGITLDMAHRVLRYEESGAGAHALHSVALDSAVGVHLRTERAPRPRTGRVKVTGPQGQTLTDERELTDPRTGGTGRTRRIMHGENALAGAAFSPGGRYLAMSDINGRVTLWDGSGARLLAVLAPGVPSSGAVPGWHVPALAFSADGRSVAVGDTDGGLRMWDTADPSSEGAALPPVDGPVLELAFTHEGAGLRVTTPYTASSSTASHTPTPVASLTASRTVELRPGRVAAEVCARAAGGLSRAQWRTYLPSVAYRKTCGGR